MYFFKSTIFPGLCCFFLKKSFEGAGAATIFCNVLSTISQKSVNCITKLNTTYKLKADNIKKKPKIKLLKKNCYFVSYLVSQKEIQNNNDWLVVTDYSG